LPAIKIFISGYYGFDNTGDEAILSVMLGQLRQELDGEIQITVVSGDPASTRAGHSIQSVLWSDTQAIAEAVWAADLVIAGGGGLFHDYGGFIPGDLFKEGNFGLGFHVTAPVLAALFRRPLMLYAVGVGPLFSEHGRRFTRAVAMAAGAVTVRDAESRTLLESIGVPADRIVVTADPAFALQPSPGVGSTILQEAHITGPQPLAAVSVRHWAVGIHPAFWQKEVAAGLDLFIDRTGGSVVFVPFQQLEGMQENDLAVAESVRGLMRHGERAAILRRTSRPDETAAILAACDVVLGMRLHSLIFSVASGVPFVGLRYDAKVADVGRQVGMDKFLLDIASVSATAIADLMSQALAGGDPATPARRQELSALALENARIAAELLTASETTPPPPPSGEVLDLIQTGVRALVSEQRRLQQTDSLRRTALQAAETQLADLTRDSESHIARLVAERGAEVTERALEASRRAAGELADVRADLGSRHRQVAALSEVVLERTAQIAALNQRITRMEALLAEQTADLAGRQQQVESLSQTVLERNQQLALLHEQMSDREARAAVANAAQTSELANLRTELEGRHRQVVSLGNALLQRTEHLAALHAQLSSLEQRETEGRDRLKQAAARISDLTGQWSAFSADYRESLSRIRSQRAWTVMLTVRRAYTLLVCSGWAGRFRFPFWVLGLLVGRPAGLSDEEPRFPAPPPSGPA
jgi:polysaccharide pyruvyl transferase CsaB